MSDTNNNLLLWQYNAYMHGMTQDTLNKPLIAVNRQHR